jgi:amino acid transporter
METPALIGAAVLGVLILLLAISLTPMGRSRKTRGGYSHSSDDYDAGDGD